MDCVKITSISFHLETASVKSIVKSVFLTSVIFVCFLKKVFLVVPHMSLVYVLKNK